MEIDIEIKFERECYKCGGGSPWTGTECRYCASTGRVATSLGEELRQFIENQKKRDAAEAAKEGGER